jgi:hypothetical protein
MDHVAMFHKFLLSVEKRVKGNKAKFLCWPSTAHHTGTYQEIWKI